MKNIILGTASTNNAKSGNIVSLSIDDKNSFKKLTPTIDVCKNYRETISDLMEIRDSLSRLKAYMLIKDKIEYDFIKRYYDKCLKDIYLFSLMRELENRFGEGIIFTSDEDVSEFSHRRVLADYIELETGEYIPEVSVDHKGYVKRINPIRYKKELYKAMRDSK